MSLVFGRQKVMELVGISRMQLSHWDKTGIVKPSIGATGKGTRRGYSFKDIVALELAKWLRDEGISLQKIRKALSYLRKNYPDTQDHFADYRFLTDGKTIFLIDKDRQKLIDTLMGGQLVISIAIGGLIERLRSEVKKIAAPQEEVIEVDNQNFTVILTPDLEEGGFTIQCKEIPAAISEGETEQECIDNIIEVLEEHFEYEKELQTRRNKAA